MQTMSPSSVLFDIVSNPEFLREGSAVEDFLRPDRIVIGADSDHAIAILKDLYSPLYLGGKTRFVITDVRTAELIKYATNAFLATKITFINEIANICDRVGSNVLTIARPSEWTVASVRSSSIRGRDSADPAFPRTPRL